MGEGQRLEAIRKVLSLENLDTIIELTHHVLMFFFNPHVPAILN